MVKGAYVYTDYERLTACLRNGCWRFDTVIFIERYEAGKVKCDGMYTLQFSKIKKIEDFDGEFCTVYTKDDSFLVECKRLKKAIGG